MLEKTLIRMFSPEWLRDTAKRVKYVHSLLHKHLYRAHHVYNALIASIVEVEALVVALPIPVKIPLPKIHRAHRSSRGVEVVEVFLVYLLPN